MSTLLRLALGTLLIAVASGCRSPSGGPPPVDPVARLGDLVDSTGSVPVGIELRVTGRRDGVAVAGLVATGSFHPGGDAELRVVGTASPSPPPTELRVVDGVVYQRGGALPAVLPDLGDRWLVLGPTGAHEVTAAATLRLFDRVRTASVAPDGRIVGTLVATAGRAPTPFAVTVAGDRIVAWEIELGRAGAAEVMLSATISDLGGGPRPVAPPADERYPLRAG